MAGSDYEYISKILEEGSITAASKSLYISQSALSQYIKRKEEALGIEIFDRNFSPLRLTEAGKIYYNSRLDILAIEEDFRTQIEELNDLKRGELVIGATDYLSYYLLSKVLRDFTRAHPGIRLRLYEAKTEMLNTAATEGEVDLALSYDPGSNSGLNNIKLYEEEVYIAINKDNPLVNDLGLTNKDGDIASIDVKDLKNQKIIGMKKGQNLRSIFAQLDKFTDSSLDYILETDSMHLAMKFVAEGLGITIVPEGLALDTRLDCIFVKTKPNLNKRNIMIHYSSTKRLKKSAQLLIRYLEDYVRDNLKGR